MDKPDERKRQENVAVEREQRREFSDQKDPLVPESSPEEKLKEQDPEISALGQRIVGVIASDPEIMDRNVWMDMRLSQKRELFQHLCNRISEQTGEPPFKADIGDIGDQSAYLFPREYQTFAKISVEKSRHADDFAREVARLHVYDLQEKKFNRDPEYADSPEGIEIERSLKVTGNLGNVRNFLVSTQSMSIAGDAYRAVEAGKQLEPPASPEKEKEVAKGLAEKPKLPQSTEIIRLDMVNVLFSEPRVYEKKQWEALKGDTTNKRQLAMDLNQSLAKLQKREPLSVQIGTRPTALYGDGGQRYALINNKEIDDRCQFLEAVGTLNLRQVQEMNLDNPDYYRGLVTNAKITDRAGEVHDMGKSNYREIQWARQGRETSGSNRIDVHTNETVLLKRDIVSAYNRLISMETERHEQHQREMAIQQKKAQATKG